MLLVDFATEVGVNTSTDIHRSLTYFTNLTYKKLGYIILCEVRWNLKQVTSSNGIMWLWSYVMAAWHPRLNISALRRSRRAAAADFLVGAPPTQYIEVSIFSWTVL